jgi:hypothetical protein
MIAVLNSHSPTLTNKSKSRLRLLIPGCDKPPEGKSAVDLVGLSVPEKANPRPTATLRSPAALPPPADVKLVRDKNRKTRGTAHEGIRIFTLPKDFLGLRFETKLYD